MATLTDEERAKAILGEEVEPTGDETPAETDPQSEDEETPEQVESPVEDESDEEKPHEEESEPDKSTESTFTKQFPNLKGETPEEYLPELEKAYDNSFKEALRLSKELKDNAAIVEQAKQIVAQGTQPANPVAPVNPSIDEHPAIQYAKAKQTEDMLAAFDDFKKQYPQATDAQAFEQFTKASDGVNATLTATYGRAPTYSELFPAIARTLGWQPNEARKNAAIKENTAVSRTSGSQTAAHPKPQKVSDAQVEAYMKLSGNTYKDGSFTSKTREDAIKELSEVV